MPESVEYLPMEKVVEVRSSGEVTEVELLETRRRVAELCERHEARGILVDARDLISLPVPSVLFDFVLSMFDAGIPRGTPFAMIAGPEIADDIGFIETVAVNRGLKFRAFSDRESALKWLPYRPPQRAGGE